MSKPFTRTRRILRVTRAGYWYLGFTILLGVTAIASANNIIYLFESFILGGLILSGILSEWAITGLELKWYRHPSHANSTPADLLVVRNVRPFPLFCLEVGEWSQGKFIPRAYIPYILPGETKKIHARSPYTERGRYKWEGIGIATSYPFGFAQKLILHPLPGRRIIWPELLPEKELQAQLHSNPGVFNFKQDPLEQTAKGGLHTGDYADGEIRPLEHGEDFRNIVWTISLTQGRPMTRIRRSSHSEPDFVLDLSKAKDLETLVKTLATRIKDQAHAKLTLVSKQNGQEQRTKIQGTHACLDALSLAKPLSQNLEEKSA